MEVSLEFCSTLHAIVLLPRIGKQIVTKNIRRIPQLAPKPIANKLLEFFDVFVED